MLLLPRILCPDGSKERLLRELLNRLVVQGELGGSEAIRTSLDTLTSWLDQARMPYQQFLL